MEGGTALVSAEGKGDGGNRIELHRYSFLALPGAFLSAIEALFTYSYSINSCSRRSRLNGSSSTIKIDADMRPP